jgi:predicted MPP superfamily phosphohydrolase
MSRPLQVATWLSILLSATVVMHAYFWWRLVAATSVGKPTRTLLTAAILGLAIFFPLPFFASRYFPHPAREIALWIGFLWMGFSLLLLAALVAGELPRAVFGLFGSADPSRRTFISRAIAVGALSIASLGALFAFWNSSREPLVRRVRVELSKFPEAMSGTTILQISDLHAGGLIRQEQIDSIFRCAGELHPDLIVLTGDLVDGSSEHHAETISAIGTLRTKFGVFFVTGNHEYYSGVEDWLTYLRNLGVRVLRNERVPIGSGNEGFDLAGIDDPQGRVLPGHGPDLSKALEGRDPNRAVILLAHTPKGVEENSRAGVDLQLSGHTHGGQIWPFTYLTRLAHPRISGEYRVGRMVLYVNPGTGFWGPPMRLWTRAEITLIELFPAP